MGIFKEKVTFDQFLADVISFSLDNLDGNLENMITACDEYHVADSKFKQEVYFKAPFLIIMDINFSCIRNLSNLIDPDQISEKTVIAYARYLKDYKKIPAEDAEKRLDGLSVFYNAYSEEVEHRKKLEESAAAKNYKMKRLDNEDQENQLNLCSAFGKFCEGKDEKTAKGKNFAAFKFAMGLVKTDIVRLYLKERSILL